MSTEVKARRSVDVASGYRIADNTNRRILDLPSDWLFDDALSAFATALSTNPIVGIGVAPAVATAVVTAPIFSTVVNVDGAIAEAVATNPSIAIGVDSAVAIASSVVVVGVAVESDPALATAIVTTPSFTLSVSVDPAIATASCTNPSVAIGVASAVALASPVVVAGVGVAYAPALATAIVTNPSVSAEVESAIATAIVTNPSVGIGVPYAYALASPVVIVGIAVGLEAGIATAYVTDPTFINFVAPDPAIAVATAPEDTLLPQIPPMPQNFVALRNVNYASVALSWGTVAGATNYKISRVDAYRGQDSVIRTEPTLSYTDTGLTVGNSYTYTVRAINEVMGVEGLRTLPIFTAGEDETLN